MNNIKEILSTFNPQNTADYFSCYKKLSKEFTKEEYQGKQKCKIALLSSFTTNGIKETLTVKCAQTSLLTEFYTGGYNQYNQEIFNDNSQLYAFNPDVTLLFLDTQTIFGDYYYYSYDYTSEERKSIINEKYQEIISLIDHLINKSSSKVILHNFEIPAYSNMGILENKQEYGLIESIEDLNKKLREKYKNNNRVFVFNYDAFCSRVGKNQLTDDKMYYLADIKLDLQHIPELCNEYLAYLKAFCSVSKKCIVLDLDNTLWGGIIGEDGIDGIKLGPSPEGKPYYEFQKYLYALYKRGIILAVNSKNNYDDAIQVLREHPYMILRENYFASIQINWQDKAENLKSIARKINIGTDSLVFFDDDKHNREIVKNILPEVLVVDLPEDAAKYSRVLKELTDFNVLNLTSEDKLKGEMYASQRKRDEYKNSIASLEDYLRNLNIVITIEKATKLTIPRIAQLTQKTNQFNLTTRRYTVDDIEKFNEDENYLVLSAKVEDKFGDNGLTCVAIIKKEGTKWIIDTFLLSCRIIGREVEKAMLAYMIEQAQSEKAKELIGELLYTNKNAPARDFYKNNSFKLINKDLNGEKWYYDLSNNFEYPEFIEVRGRLI